MNALFWLGVNVRSGSNSLSPGKSSPSSRKPKDFDPLGDGIGYQRDPVSHCKLAFIITATRTDSTWVGESFDKAKRSVGAALVDEIGITSALLMSDSLVASGSKNRKALVNSR